MSQFVVQRKTKCVDCGPRGWTDDEPPIPCEKCGQQGFLYEEVDLTDALKELGFFLDGRGGDIAKP